MKSENVNLRKIDRMAVLAFKNSLRLHEDAIILFNKHRFPSAYTLSVLSLEELGKYFSLEDFFFIAVLMEDIVHKTRKNSSTLSISIVISKTNLHIKLIIQDSFIFRDSQKG